QLNTFSVRVATNNTSRSVLTPWDVEGIGWITEIREPPSEPPPNPPQSSPLSPKQPQYIQLVGDRDLEVNAITKVDPVYPAPARAMKAMGEVRVQITISETGRVIDAKAVSGHNALRPAAVEAAYKWVFKPTTVDGTPIKVQGVLTFNFRNSI